MSEINSLGVAITSAIVSFLPSSPFRAFINSIGTIPYLAQLNWFIPIPEMIAVTQVWVTIIGIYYSYMGLMRVAKLIS